VPTMLFTDCTSEQLAVSLSTIWPSAGFLIDEGGNFFGSHAMRGPSLVKTLGLMNTLWDAKRYSVDRRSSEPIVLNGVRLIVAIMIQEEPLASHLNQSCELLRGSGFLARFNVVVVDSPQVPLLYQGPIDSPGLRSFNLRIRECLQTPGTLNVDGTLCPPRLTLSPDAKHQWVQYHDLVQAEMVDGRAYSDIRDFAAKSADNAARLAALFHVFEGRQGPIEVDHMNYACSLAMWYLNEARRFVGKFLLPVEMSDALKLDAYLVRFCNQNNTVLLLKNDARRSGPIRTATRLTAALKELISLDRIALVSINRSAVIKVNPKLLKSTIPDPYSNDGFGNI